MTRNLCSLAILVTLHGCAAVLREERPWSFVTAIGGLELAPPVHLKSRWELPVRVDVTGLHAITNEPTIMNSGLVCDATKARVEGRDSRIVIVTTIPHGDVSTLCPSAKLGALAPGQYNILYGANRAEGVPLGVINVEL
jgi:hypothetical protein